MTVHYFPLSTACMSLYKIIQSRCAQTRVVPSCTEYSAEKGNRKPDWNNNPFPPGKKREAEREREEKLAIESFRAEIFPVEPFHLYGQTQRSGDRGKGWRGLIPRRYEYRERWQVKGTMTNNDEEEVKEVHSCEPRSLTLPGHVPRARLNTFTDHFPISFLRPPAHFPRDIAPARAAI